jgi:hypothetical protein
MCRHRRDRASRVPGLASLTTTERANGGFSKYQLHPETPKRARTNLPRPWFVTAATRPCIRIDMMSEDRPRTPARVREPSDLSTSGTATRCFLQRNRWITALLAAPTNARYWDRADSGAFKTVRASSIGPMFPAPPGAQTITHHQLKIAAAQPGQFFSEHCHAVLPGTGHFGDVGPPKHARGAKRIEDLVKIRLHPGVRVAPARVARCASGLDCDVGMPGELQKVGNVRHGGGVVARLVAAATSEVIDGQS